MGASSYYENHEDACTLFAGRKQAVKCNQKSGRLLNRPLSSIHFGPSWPEVDSAFGKEKADNCEDFHKLSARRLCGWLFDNNYIKLLNIHQDFLLALWAEQWKIQKGCILSQFNSSFPSTNRA
jgi:hypothetical protein